MPRPPPVTSTVRSAALPSFLIVASTARIAVATELLLRLAVEDRLHRRQTLDEALDRLRSRNAQLRREQVIHVELLAGTAGALHVEPEREGDADDETGGRDGAHQA